MSVESPEDAARKAEWANLLREKAFWQGLLELAPCELKAFFDEVINGQNVEVDAISGATLDSNNLLDALKAIFK